MSAAEKLVSRIESLPPEAYAQVIEFVDRIESGCDLSDTLLLSEAALARDWNRPEEDEAWADL